MANTKKNPEKETTVTAAAAEETTETAAAESTAEAKKPAKKSASKTGKTAVKKDAAPAEETAEPQKKAAKKAKKTEDVQPAAEEEAKPKFTGKLDDKTIASLPAASIILANERLRDLLVKGKKKGKLDSSELSEVLDDMDLEGDQMDSIYDTLELLGIDTSGEDYLLRLYTIQEPENYGRTVTLHLEVLTEERESVCSLEFVRYWPD